jgi:tetratricopeptide (TPR) repeat protein
MANADATRAKTLEQEAREFPDQRGEALLEAALAWRRAGDIDRAVELMTDLAAEGGEDGCSARFELAETYFETGEDAKAEEQLLALSHDPDLHEGHCEMVAELLAERNQLEQAARWYDRAVARLSDDQVKALETGDDWTSMIASHLVHGRREVRRRLGLDPDVLDQITETTSTALFPEVPTGPVRLRLPIFSRAHLAEARRRWPTLVQGTDDEYFAANEAAWKTHSETATANILLVSVTPADYAAYADRTGRPPEERGSLTEYALAAEETVSWPPERNAPCWCGGGRKYKKCCGRPT